MNIDKIKKHVRLIILIILIILFLAVCVYRPAKNIETVEEEVVAEQEKIIEPKPEPKPKPEPEPQPVPPRKEKELDKKPQNPPPTKQRKPVTKKYHPYIEIGELHFFNANDPDWATTLDLFVPVWQSEAIAWQAPQKTIFINPRFTDRTGAEFEINLHAGYRQLLDGNRKMIGLYAGFDRKKTDLRAFFNQVMIGGEYWQKLPRGNLFLGFNLYQPIGAAHFIGGHSKEKIESYKNNQFKNVGVTKDLQYEKAMPGFDAEIGYELIPGLIGYAGGYYFHAIDVEPIYGPKTRLTYDLYKKDGGRVLGLFEKIGFIVGAQYDTPRGFTCYTGINIRLSWLRGKRAPLTGLSLHMIDPIRRDIDIVSDDYAKRSSKKINKKLKQPQPIDKKPEDPLPLKDDLTPQPDDTPPSPSLSPSPSTPPPSPSPSPSTTPSTTPPPKLPKELKKCQENGNERTYEYESDDLDAYLSIYTNGYNITSSKTLYDRTDIKPNDNKQFINKQTIYACCTDRSITPTIDSPYNHAINSTYTTIWPDQNTLSCQPGEGVKAVECLCHHRDALAVFKLNEININQNTNETTIITAR